MADGEQMLPADEELFAASSPDEQPVQPVAEPVVEQPIEQPTEQPMEQPMEQDDQVEQQEPQIEHIEQPIEKEEVIEPKPEPEDPVINANEVAEAPEPVVEEIQEPHVSAPQIIPFLNDHPARMQPLFHNEPPIEYYDDHQNEEPLPPPIDLANLFQPAPYDPSFQGDDEEGRAEGPENAEEIEERNKHDANEHTVWIDSDPEDNNTEEDILKANFWLPYSDHNYDCADPLDRVNHPLEGPFPIIEGLDERGNITKQYMPDEDPNNPREESESPGTSAMGHHEQQQHNVILHPQQQNIPFQRMVVQRPVATTQPFSVGGAEYQRTEPQQRLIQGANNTYRMVNDYGMGSVPVRAPTQRVAPAAAIIRGRPEMQGGNVVYQSPQQVVRAPAGVVLRRPIPAQQQQQQPPNAAPGSYQHIAQPLPGGSIRRANLISRPMPPGYMQPRQAAVRPLQVNNMEADYDAPQLHPAPQAPAPPPVQRRIVGVAPHRMTPEQLSELQRSSQRPAARFPIEPQQQPGSASTIATQVIPAGGAARPGPARLLVRGPGPPPTGAGVLVRARAISGGAEELLRSPQRVPGQSPQRVPGQSPQHQLHHHQQPHSASSSPRKFQLKVADIAPTYSAPIPKVSDQLPAQITEDEPEEEPTSSAAPIPVKVEEDPQDGPPAQLLEEETVPSRHASPVKPTPPHRMGQEEKNAHLARLMADKEKPINTASPIHQGSSTTPAHQSSSQHHHVVKPNLEIPPNSTPLPLRRSGHQEDTLAMVQSVFETNKPRLPDTPKDKEAISKIADHLRFSAEKYETNKAPDASRRRNDSAMSHGSHGHGSYQQHHDAAMMDRDDGRRKRQSLTRFDMQHPQHPHPSNSGSLMRQQQHQPPHRQQQHHDEHNEPLHRSRGRPKGSGGTPRNRYVNEPIAPHRVGGGARTLQPRQQAQSSSGRNGRGVPEDSDSESDRIEEGWTMRCHCGMSHPTGNSVECEKCKAWQHTFCMGLTKKSNTDGYMCELCLPRQLPVSKAEAIRIQKKEIARIKKEEKREQQRRSEPPEPPKKEVASSSAHLPRKSAPAYRSPPPPPKPKLNDYSKGATALLRQLPPTQGAEQLLDDARQNKKAKRMFVSENVEALVTTEIISARAVLIEMNGLISMIHEVKRQPGGGGHIFLYDGLMKGAAGEDTGETQELIVVDTRKRGNDTKLTRRSCQPNCVLKHVLGEGGTLGVMLVATREIPYNQEVTLPFDADWLASDLPLECSEHILNPHDCPFEAQRMREAHRRNIDRRRIEDADRRKKEAERAEREETKRLEDEVRREREEKIRKQVEDEKKAAREAKKKEEEAAKKKKEKAEKAAHRASVDSSIAEAASTSSVKSEPHKMTRDERQIQQAEERFRRQEEEEKRKIARAQEKALAKERKSMSKTPDHRGQGTSDDGPGPSTSSKKTPSILHKNLLRESKSTSVEGETPKRASKRHESVMQERTASPPAKRPRATTVREDIAIERAKKRASTAKSSTTASKKTKDESGKWTAKDIANTLEKNAKTVIQNSDEFILPSYISERSASSWVETHKKSRDEAKNARENKAKKVDEKQQRQSMEGEKERKEARKEMKREAEEMEARHKEKREKKEAEKRKKEEAARAQRDSEGAGPAPKAPTPAPVQAQAPVPTPAPDIVHEIKQEIKQEIDATPTAPETLAAPPPPPEQREPTPAKSEASASAGSVKDDSSSKESREPSEAKDLHRESREGSEAKDGAPKKGGAGPKKLSLEQYKQKRATINKDEASTSGTPSTSAPPRHCFIPSTDSSSTANARLSNIFLPGSSAMFALPSSSNNDQHPSTSNIAASSSQSEDEPAAHSQSLADRAASVFGLIPGLQPTPSAPSSSSRPNDARKPRVTRWN